MKKFLCILTAVAMFAGIAATAAGCGGTGNDGTGNGGGQKMSGTLSAKYSTIQEAATACVNDEIAGAATNATYVGYTAEKLLNDGDLKKLDITDEQRADITRAEEGTIKYSVTGEDGQPAEESHKIIILNIGNGVYYFLADPQAGEPMTKSYFEKLNASPAENFTLSFDMDMTMTMTTADNVSSTLVDSSTTLDIKFTGDKLWMYTLLPGLTVDGTPLPVETFYQQKDGKLMKYYVSDGELTFSSYVENDTIDDLLNENYPTADTTVSAIDHSYFCRTETGFSIAADKNDEFTQMLLDMLESLGTNIENVESELQMDYTVTDGIATAGNCDCYVSMSINGVKAELFMTMTMDLTDIGTTVIEYEADPADAA